MNVLVRCQQRSRPHGFVSVEQPPCGTTAYRSRVYFFLDFSNIAIGASQLAPQHGDGSLGCNSVRLSSSNIRLLAERNRIWEGGYAAAGLTDQQSLIKRCFERDGIRFDICERGQLTGKEQNVDKAIQLEMYRLLSPGVRKGTVVLATGDGNGFADRNGFIEALSTLHSYGFSVEVLAWRHSFNRILRDWTIEHGRVIELDNYYKDLTFLHGGRSATAPHIFSRKMAREGLIHGGPSARSHR